MGSVLLYYTYKVIAKRSKVTDYPIVEDVKNDVDIDRNDVNVTMTFAEHELILDVITQAVNSIEFASFYGICDLPIDSEIVQKYTMIENLREKFYTALSDRFYK